MKNLSINGLTATAKNNFQEWLDENSTIGLDALQCFDSMEYIHFNEKGELSNACYELASHNSKTGNPITYDFESSDLITEELIA